MVTAIEWTDRVWNPTTGCDRVSPGCDNCYALTMAKRLKGMGQAKYQRDGDPRTSGPGFGLTVHPDALGAPLGWRKPARVFVNSMSDLFHADVPDGFIARVWAVMAATPQHTYQVLTKRHGRMRSLLSRPEFTRAVMAAIVDLGLRLPAYARAGMWPLLNVWLGVSVEDQKRADLRIPALLDTPAAVRFLSCEPLLGELDVERWICTSCQRTGYVDDQNWSPEYPELWRGERSPGNGRVPCGDCNHGGWHVDDVARPGIDWVIVGGESGPGARPLDVEWVRSLVEQCEAADVPAFVKQLGSHYGPGKGGDIETFPADLRVREFPAVAS